MKKLEACERKVAGQSKGQYKPGKRTTRGLEE
jgi:hypothetical protein